jgi:23S rRNA maturation mini-RNase III
MMWLLYVYLKINIVRRNKKEMKRGRNRKEINKKRNNEIERYRQNERVIRRR